MLYVDYLSAWAYDALNEHSDAIIPKAWKNLSQLKDMEKFRPWLCHIARTTVQNWLRRQKRDAVSQAAALEASMGRPSADLDPAKTTIQREYEALVSQAAAQLPEAQRLVLVLFYREHQSTADVAQLLDISEVAVRQRISRARQALRDKIQTVRSYPKE